MVAVRQFWRERVTAVFARHGKYARDVEAVNAFPPADLTIEHIGDLLDCDLSRLCAAAARLASGER